MKIVKKNVYYCEFCKKHSLRSLAEHEKSCTLNPDRHCKLCDIAGFFDGKLVDEAINKIFLLSFEQNTIGYKNIKISELQFNEITGGMDGCPACLASVVRRAWKIAKEKGIRLTFEKLDLKERFNEFWRDINSMREDYDGMFGEMIRR